MTTFCIAILNHPNNINCAEFNLATTDEQIYHKWHEVRKHSKLLFHKNICYTLYRSFAQIGNMVGNSLGA
jgi:hypothetical protein